MGNKKDGKNDSNIQREIKAYGEDGLEMYGNTDAKKLAKAYKEASKNGLSPEEIEKLIKLDDTLKGAEYKVLGHTATLVVQEENNIETDFIVLRDGMKQNTGFVNSKPKPKTR